MAELVQKCAGCRFYFGTTCKRFPAFQEKDGSEWCGEYEQAPVYPEPPDSNAEAGAEGESVGSA